MPNKGAGQNSRGGLVEHLRPEKVLFPANCEERPILTFFDTLDHN